MSGTKIQILNIAQEFTQKKGINGFSYIDIANKLGIKTSSIHYHFKTKSDLALAMVERMHNNILDLFDNLELEFDLPQKRLEKIVNFFQKYAEENKHCLCGMMATELESVSPDVKKSLELYFDDFQNWIEKQFDSMGCDNPENISQQFISSLEGSLLLARLKNKPDIVTKVLASFIAK